ncbi:hypothetical protein N9934_04025 [Desulfosarcina sp.]|nr:hypothetical protein [Desulfosarcina sp.]
MIEFIISQIVALICFFAFPIMQYLLLKRSSQRDGNPELWYLPDYGFRLVIRNMPRKRILSDIKYRALLRTRHLPSEGASVRTLEDRPILNKEDFFLFPGVDQVLISFRLENNDEYVLFIYTDKLSNEIERYRLGKKDSLIVDYIATIKNWFNFDIKIAKRVVILFPHLVSIYKEICENNIEQEFQVSRILNVS